LFAGRSATDAIRRIYRFAAVSSRAFGGGYTPGKSPQKGTIL
jgi:hypothetical protein